MRTTLDLDDAVLDAARAVARSTKRSLGAVVSEWARRGATTPGPPTGRKRRLPTFSVRPGARPIDDARVKEALDDEGVPA